ncbi:MAG TPA: glutamine--fructose-6-phosphate transaminase (isomerizing), partial [Saprospiraceae bacterium]|nr:glutamine--fructose-6-phosphate transaminase (isomerizing) [Saprospiraceae bacterium]
MCGIVAKVGSENVLPFLIEGLKRLEYRGYDSAGVALISNDTIVFSKKKGKVAKLEKELENNPLEGHIGIGHTRWATHGKPDDINAHPHLCNDQSLALVHNGIIENYQALKEVLISFGYTFYGQADTEVLVNFIDYVKKVKNIGTVEATKIALKTAVGAYAIVLFDKDNPEEIIAARKSSPMVLGIGKNALYIASDVTPIVKYTNKIVYLNDEEIVVARKNGAYQISNLNNEVVTPIVHEIDVKIEALEKGGYEHFMLKEIYQQPATITDSMRGRISAEENWVHLNGIEENLNRFLKAQRIIIIGCGTSWHSGMIGEYLIEDLARISVEVEYASEFRYRNPILTEQDIVIAISQSGETADTLAALELAKEKGAFLYGIVNVVGSSIARLVHSGSYIHAGPEIGVASTKAFTSQIVILLLIALRLGKAKGTIDERKYIELINALDSVPTKVQTILDNVDQIKYIAREIKDHSNAIYLGRGISFPVALEGALKLKEISYIHAEGYPAAEMKHGPIALIDEDMPVFVIANNESAYEKIISNVQEVKARKGKVIAIVPFGEKIISKIADHCIFIPEIEDQISALLSVVPLQ